MQKLYCTSDFPGELKLSGLHVEGKQKDISFACYWHCKTELTYVQKFLRRVIRLVLDRYFDTVTQRFRPFSISIYNFQY